MADQERIFLTRWIQLAQGCPEPVAQYKAIPARKFRWDYAWVDHKILLEVQGGTWSGGAHARGAGIRRDADKNNLAVAAGWRCFYATADLLRDDPSLLISQIKGLISKSELVDIHGA